MKIILRRSGLALIPMDEQAMAAVAKIPQGADVAVTTARPRNAPQHRLFFALLHKTIEAGAEFASENALLGYLKDELGHYDVVMKPDGSKFRMLRSVAFESMDQDSFAKFFNEAIDLICRDVLPGADKDDLVKEIYAMINPTADYRR